MQYPELKKLAQYLKQHQIVISKSQEIIRNDLFFVQLSIDGQQWKVLIDDEFGDFAAGNVLMDWFLILYALELYDECEDILEWSRELNIQAANFLAYYKSLGTTYSEIEAKIGEIDACISTFDYTLNTGVTQTLRNYKKG